jgi:hypothetical protein
MMKLSTLKKTALLSWLIVIAILIVFIYSGHTAEVISKNPVLIHEAGHLYTISGHVYVRRCSVDKVDHFDITGIDAKTFQSLNDVYVKDKNGIWNLGVTQVCGYPQPLILDPPVDLSTFVTFATSSFMAKDNISLIYNDRRLASPSKSTVYLGFNYYEDGNQIYKHAGYGELLPLTTVPADARPVSQVYLVDGTHVYDAGNVWIAHTDTAFVVAGADPSSFAELSKGYSRDKNNVYYKSVVVSSADPASFKKVSNQAESDEDCGFSYWKDAHNVYLKGSLIPSADPDTFRVIQYQGQPCNIGQYSVDKNHVFYGNTLVPGVDLSTFVYKGGVTIADSRTIYVAGSKCTSATTTVTDKKIGYSLQIPPGWNYMSDSEYGRDNFFDCADVKGFSIAKGAVHTDQNDHELQINNQFIPNAHISGWTYDSEEGSGRTYQVVFPQSNVSFILNSVTPLEDNSVLSSLVPVE